MAPPLGDMPAEEFRRFGHEAVDWIADYLAHPERYPVGPTTSPGELTDQLPAQGPEQGEPFEQILADFERLIVPKTVQWNHPGFLAWFAAGGSAPGVIAEALTAALNQVGLLWKASPALVEVEQTTLAWLANWLGLPTTWFGMIHDTASTASLHALIAARQAAADRARAAGRDFRLDRLTVYASEHAHMSIEKALLALGLGAEACRKIPADAEYRLRPEALETAVAEDRRSGFEPAAVTATIGTTSSAAVDPVPAIAEIAARQNLWLHVDAAYAGAAALLPEKRRFFAGCERADSFVMNPHKWLFAPMDVSAFYTARPEVFERALSLTPEYLRHEADPRAVNLMEYSVPLGRRFRALKLWFILRYFGRQGLADRVREHCRLAQDLARRIDEHPDFETVAPVHFSLVCLRWRPQGVEDERLDQANERLVEAVNATGDFLLSGTRLSGKYVIRVAIGQIRTDEEHVDRLWRVVQKEAERLLGHLTKRPVEG